MATPSSSETGKRTRTVTRRGAFYSGIGYALIVGMLIVVGLGVIGVTGLGWFTLGTAMAMIGLSITLLGVVAFISLMSMRRTIDLLGHQGEELAEQADRQAALAREVQERHEAEQLRRDLAQDEALASHRTGQMVRDWEQDDRIAELDDRESFRSAQALQDAQHRRDAKAPPKNPFGYEGAEIHPVVDVEGIGDHYSERLNNLGIEDTQDLWKADAVEVATELEISPDIVRDWQSMAELMAAEGIAHQYAELLVRVNVASLAELCTQNPERLKGRIEKLKGRLKKRVQGNEIGIKRIDGWIRAAETHHDGAPRVSETATAADGA